MASPSATSAKKLVKIGWKTEILQITDCKNVILSQFFRLLLVAWHFAATFHHRKSPMTSQRLPSSKFRPKSLDKHNFTVQGVLKTVIFPSFSHFSSFWLVYLVVWLPWNGISQGVPSYKIWSKSVVKQNFTALWVSKCDFYKFLPIFSVVWPLFRVISLLPGGTYEKVPIHKIWLKFVVKQKLQASKRDCYTLFPISRSSDPFPASSHYCQVGLPKRYLLKIFGQNWLINKNFSAVPVV